MAQYDDLNSRSIALVGLFSGLITFITILGSQVLYYAMNQRQEERKVMSAEYNSSLDHLAAQANKLKAPAGEVYRESGIELTEADLKGRKEGEAPPAKYKTIPIDKAIQAIVKEKGQTVDSGKSKDEA
jgi:hypothetical protein